MKNLYLLRHAKAEPVNLKENDFERSLIKKGKQQSLQIAEIVKPKIKIDCIITSPAFRAIETAFIFASVIKHPHSKIIINEKLFTNHTIDIFKFLYNHARTYNNILVVGHNPVLTHIAFTLTNTIDHMPKASIVGVTIDCKSWRSANIDKTTLLFFEYLNKDKTFM